MKKKEESKLKNAEITYNINYMKQQSARIANIQIVLKGGKI